MALPSLPSSRAVASPCTGVCAIDGATGFCIGCCRTLSEIGGWSGLDDAGRDRIMADLAARRARIGTGRPTF